MKLNSITIRDAFPLPHIDETLLTVHTSNIFASFNLVQGYLQLAMVEDNIKKTAFRTGSSGLYEYTGMSFVLSNARSSFCRLIEQCLGDQQFVTLLLYLDNICIFAPGVSTMLDWIQLVFIWLKSFNLKIKPKNVINWNQAKKCYFLGQCDFSGSCLVSQWNICQPRKGWQSNRLANAKECQWIAFIPRFGILLLPVYPKLCLHRQMLTPTYWSNEHKEDKK